jgi:hypothetical protein
MKNKIVAVWGIMLLVLVFGVVAHAQGAKVDGTWVMTNKGRNGVVTTTLTLTQDGITLNGTMRSKDGVETPIDDGNMSGNNITFTVTRPGQNKVEYKGTVDGETMKGTFMQGENSVEWTARRSSR